MKWACIIILIIDLILVGLASFRYLTVPNSEVAAYKDRFVREALSDEELEILETEPEVRTPPAQSSNSADQDDDFNNKEIDLTGEELWDYDDQAVKQEGMDRAKQRINAVFGSGDDE